MDRSTAVHLNINEVAFVLVSFQSFWWTRIRSIRAECSNGYTIHATWDKLSGVDLCCYITDELSVDVQRKGTFLRLETGRDCDAAVVMPLMKQYTHMKGLRVNNCTNLTPEMLAIIVQSNLVRVSLHNNHTITTPLPSKTLSKHSITRLDFRNFSALTDEGLLAAARECAVSSVVDLTNDDY